MVKQAQFNNISEPVHSVETYEFEPIQGYPMLHWKGKRPFRSTQYYPAQLKEMYGKDIDNWANKIYWGDNLQVMSHLLKAYRGKINLIYIDPPFDAKVDYKKQIELKGRRIQNDRTAFEDKQYTDIWTNDEYLQFMYERVILMRELLADDGSIYVHCDWRMNSYIRLILDEVFGKANLVNEIIWFYRRWTAPSHGFQSMHDTILFYSKTQNPVFNKQYVETSDTRSNMKRGYNTNTYMSNGVRKRQIIVEDRQVFDQAVQENKIDLSKYERIVYREQKGTLAFDVFEIPIINPQAKERVGYPTQKPEPLLELIIKASSNPGDLVFDCFMGSGTTQAVAMKLGRRFIGADINLGAVETTTKRLTNLAVEIEKNTAKGKISSQEESAESIQTFYAGLEIYNVNHYDIFRNPVEAKDLLIEALEIQPLFSSGIYDGEKDGRMVKIMPINRIATRADLNELITGFDYRTFEKRQEEHPTHPVEKLLLVCMGHEPDLAGILQREVPHKLDIEVIDILRDKSTLEFKRESKARIVRSNGKLIIKQFYPMNLLQKLSFMKENVEDWKELVESVKVDFNYDGAVFNPSVIDPLEDDEFVKGTYPIPADVGTIRVKITDLLSESLEVTVE